jgi:hypothetical protein
MHKHKISLFYLIFSTFCFILAILFYYHVRFNKLNDHIQKSVVRPSHRLFAPEMIALEKPYTGVFLEDASDLT